MAVAWVTTAAISGVSALVGGAGFPAEPMQYLMDPVWTWAARATIVAAILFAFGPLRATVRSGTDDRERADARA